MSKTFDTQIGEATARPIADGLLELICPRCDHVALVVGPTTILRLLGLAMHVGCPGIPGLMTELLAGTYAGPPAPLPEPVPA